MEKNKKEERITKKILGRKNYSKMKKIKNSQERKEASKFLVRNKIEQEIEDFKNKMIMQPRKINDWTNYQINIIKLKKMFQITKTSLDINDLKKTRKILQILNKELRC